MDKKLTKGGPGDKYLGGGHVDTSEWFQNIPNLEKEIKDEEIWFCTAPFQMIYTSTRGELIPCSWAEENIGPNIKNTKGTEYYRKDNMMKALRKEMLTPGSDLKLVEEVCKNCRYQEKHFGRSRRQAALKIQSNDKMLWPRIRNAAEEFRKDGRVTFKERLLEVQVKAFGNTCNLDCYMCIPYDSSTRLATIHSEELKGETVFSDFAKTAPVSVDQNTMDDIIDDIASIAPYIYNLKLIGGEPLVMKKFYKLLEKIIETGEAKHIIVKYQTNMSTLEFEKIKIAKFIPHFHIFEFTVSLDSMGEANNYIRRRSNWDEIVNNIKHVRQYPNVEVNINGAISFLSVLRFHELIDWVNDNLDLFNQVNWSNIRSPAKLCANVLPSPLKEKLIPLYKGFPDIQQLLERDPVGLVPNKPDFQKELNYQDTLDYLLMVDEHYKGTKWEMDLFDTFPELKEYHTPKERRIELINSNKG